MDGCILVTSRAPLPSSWRLQRTVHTHTHTTPWSICHPVDGNVCFYISCFDRYLYKIRSVEKCLIHNNSIIHKLFGFPRYHTRISHLDLDEMLTNSTCLIKKKRDTVILWSMACTGLEEWMNRHRELVLFQSILNFIQEDRSYKQQQAICLRHQSIQLYITLYK